MKTAGKGYKCPNCGCKLAKKEQACPCVKQKK